MPLCDVAVVVPAFNAERWLDDALKSVLCQTWRPTECFVVDDGSTDGTRAIAHGFRPDGVQLLSQPRGGVSRARNLGSEQATARYLAFLDADDVWLPKKLELQIKAIEASPSAGLCYGGYLITNEDLVPVTQVVPPPAEEVLRRTLFMEPPPAHLASTAVIPVDVFRSVGGFRNDLSTAADSDLAVRLLLRSDAVCVRETVALYRQHGGQMHHDVLALEHDIWQIIDSTFSTDGLPEGVHGQRRRAIASLEMTLMAHALSRSAYSTSALHGIRALRADPPRAAQLLLEAMVRRSKRAVDAVR